MDKRRRKSSVTEKLALLDKYRSLMPLSQRQAAQILNISRGHLQNLLKNESTLRNSTLPSQNLLKNESTLRNSTLPSQNLLKNESTLRNSAHPLTLQKYDAKVEKEIKMKKASTSSVRTRRERTVGEKLALLDKYRSMPMLSQRQTAKILNISRGLLQNLIRNEEAIRDQVSTPAAKRIRFGKDNKVDEDLVDWLKFAQSKDLPINGDVLKEKASEIAQDLGHFEFKASDDWYSHWKKSHGLDNSSKVQSREEQFSNGTESNHQSAEEILQNFSPENIYSAHETALYFCAMPGSTPRDKVTLLVTCSLDGKKEEVVLVGKSGNPKCTKTIKNPSIPYYTSPNGCMSSAIFEQWLLSWDRRLQSENRKIVLFVKNCDSHKFTPQFLNISVHFITSSTLTVSLPCEMGLCTALKAYYRYEMRHRVTEILEDSQNISVIDDAVRKIDLEEVMLMVKTAWAKIPIETIRSCWKIAGFRESNLDLIDNELAHIQLPDPPVGVTAEQFATWVMIDNDVDTVEVSTDDNFVRTPTSELCGQDDDNGQSCFSDAIEEVPPDPTEMRRCLDRVRVGLQQTDFEDMEAFYSLKRKIDYHLRERFPFNQRQLLRFFNSED